MNARTALAIMLIIVSLPLVHAAGLGLSPSIFGFDDLARGSDYEKHLKVLNLNEGSQVFTINATGPAASWIRMVDETSGDPLPAQLSVPGNGEYRFLTIIAVPRDAPNGQYRGTIDVSPVSEENSANVVVQGVYTFTVTGTQTRSASVESITTSDTESGQLVRFDYDVRNTGNVAIVPHARVDVSKDGTFIDSAEADGSSIKAGAFTTESLEWNSENRGTGNFTATVTVTLDGTDIGTRDVSFSLLPRGTLSADAIAGSTAGPASWAPGEVGKLTVPVYNTGKIDVNAKVTSEVTHNGKLIDVVASDEKLVPAGKSTTLEYYFTPPAAGEYTIAGKVVYSGKEVAIEPMVVRVASPDAVNRQAITDTRYSRSRLVTFGLIVLLAMIIVGIGAMGLHLSRKR